MAMISDFQDKGDIPHINVWVVSVGRVSERLKSVGTITTREFRVRDVNGDEADLILQGDEYGNVKVGDRVHITNGRSRFEDGRWCILEGPQGTIDVSDRGGHGEVRSPELPSLEDLSKLITPAEVPVTGPEGLSEMMARADDCLQRGQYEEAARLCDQVLLQEPTNVDAYVTLGIALAGQDRLVDAVRCQKMVTEMDPSNAEAWAQLGRGYQELGMHEQALEAYSTTLGIHRENPDVLMNAGIVLSQIGSIKDSVSCYRESLEYNPDDPRTLYNYGLLMYDYVGDANEAFAAIERALELDPGYADAWNDRGRILMDNGNVEAARGCYQRALQADNTCAKAWANMGSLLMGQNNINEGVMHLETALKLDRTLVNTWVNLGRARYMHQEDLPGALSCFDQALELDPENEDALIMKGHILMEADHIPDGLRHFEIALQAHPDSAHAWSGKGYALCVMGRVEEGMPCVERALQINPDHNQANNVRRQFTREYKKRMRGR